MRSRYGQVALAYARALGPRIGAAMLAIHLLVLASGFRGFALQRPRWPIFTYPVQARVAIVIIGIAVCGGLALVVTAHAKEQLADWRSRLVPRFRGPHLVVAAALMAAVAFALPWLTARSLLAVHEGSDRAAFDVTALGTIALTTAVVAMSAWLANLQSLPFLALFFGMFTPLATSGGQGFVGHILSGASPAACWGMIAASSAALGVLFWRLATMHEGMAEYARLDVTHGRLRPAMTGDARARREGAAEAGGANEFLRGTAALQRPWPAHGAGFWRRAWYWRAGLGMGHVYALVGALVALWGSLVPHLARGHDAGAGVLVVVAPQVFALMLPIVLAGQAWPRRWQVLGVASLRPIPRSQFIREQGAAMALDLAMAWGLIMLGALLPSVILYPRNFLSGAIWFSLLAMACAQVLLFGANVWVLRLRSAWLSLATLAGSAAAQILLIALVAALIGQFPLLGAGLVALLLLLGVGITYDAYRRWLITDLN